MTRPGISWRRRLRHALYPFGGERPVVSSSGNAAAGAAEITNLAAKAASTVGNQGAVASSKAAALAAAAEFVGPGARPIYKAGEVIGKISADG